MLSREGSENALPAIRAKIRCRVYSLAAHRAGSEGFVGRMARQGPAGLSKYPPAAVAFQKDLPPLDRKEGNKEKTQVMVHAHEPGRRHAALGTGPWVAIHLNLSRLYSADADEDEDAPPFEAGSAFSANPFSRPFRQ